MSARKAFMHSRRTPSQPKRTRQPQRVLSVQLALSNPEDYTRHVNRNPWKKKKQEFLEYLHREWELGMENDLKADEEARAKQTRKLEG
jgi:hypothetical protein